MHGRKFRRRFRLKDHATKIAAYLGGDLRLVKRSGTVGKLIAEFPAENMIVRVRGHVFAVRDGVVLDQCPVPPRKQVIEAWIASPLVN
jgi:hypothetical protein